VTITLNNSILQSDNLHPKPLRPKLYILVVGNFFAVVRTFNSGLLENFKIKEPLVLGFWGHFQNQRTCGSGFTETFRLN
jgi:hypothetical protein